jgi:hypothetical protein
MTAATLVTCSFAGDWELCRLLCESVDRFVPESIGHALFVPARDLRLFADLATRRRVIASQESLLPGFWKAPLPPPRWREMLGLPRRDIYLTPFSAPVRGWIAQQIMKIAAAAAAPAEIVVHADSDCVFVRPLLPAHLARGGRARFQAEPVEAGLASHRPWYEAAARLLGLPEADYYRADYIDQILVWRRSVARGLIDRLETVAGRDWRVTLARAPRFAEYVLYGVYAERVIGLDSAGLFRAQGSLCHSRWAQRIDGSRAEAEFAAALRRDHVACMIQSAIPMPVAARRRLFQRVARLAARQDEGRPQAAA